MSSWAHLIWNALTPSYLVTQWLHICSYSEHGWRQRPRTTKRASLCPQWPSGEQLCRQRPCLKVPLSQMMLEIRRLPSLHFTIIFYESHTFQAHFTQMFKNIPGPQILLVFDSWFYTKKSCLYIPHCLAVCATARNSLWQRSFQKKLLTRDTRVFRKRVWLWTKVFSETASVTSCGASSWQGGRNCHGYRGICSQTNDS